MANPLQANLQTLVKTPMLDASGLINREWTKFMQALIDSLNATNDLQAQVGYILDSSAANSGPTVQNVITGSRVLGTVYQNTTGKALFVTVTLVFSVASGGTASVNAVTDSNAAPTTVVGAILVSLTATGLADTLDIPISFIVLPGNYYKVATIIGAPTLNTWTEWN